MHIEELNARKGQKSITITMNYDGVRDIANGLYYLTSGTPCEEGVDKYKTIAADCKLLFDLVKHGNIQPETVKKMASLQDVKK